MTHAAVRGVTGSQTRVLPANEGTSLSRASYFLVVPPEDCRDKIVGPDGAQEKSMEQEGRGEGTTFERIA